MKRTFQFLSIFVIAFLISNSLWSQVNGPFKIVNGNLKIEVNNYLETRINSLKAKIDFEKYYSSSETITLWKNEIKKFKVNEYIASENYKDSIGVGKQYKLSGIYNKGGIQLKKTVSITCYDQFPDLAIFNVSYVNMEKEPLKMTRWTNNRHNININPKDTTFWSFQGSSTSARADWILKVPEDFYQKNYMGMNNLDYGGGIPIVDVWRSDGGLAVGHTTLYPQLVSLPVEREHNSNSTQVSISKQYPEGYELAKDVEFKTLETFVSVHSGDCFQSLHEYTEYMKVKGLKFAEPEPAAYEPIWCAWGYERGFTLEEIVGTLDKAKEIGFKWAVLDDGFQLGEGDWEVNSTKFPGGSDQMKQFVDDIHSHGMKAKIWWAPLAVDPCTNLLNENPDIILYTDEWAPRVITWWDAYYMSPIYSKTITHTNKTLDMFVDEWGFDGLKMDGQHMNAVPPDHHPKHNLDYPEQACEQLPNFYKSVYETTRNKKKNAVIENCPCGCCMSFYNMPYINQAVSSDPLSSWQIRLKGKVYKAILGKTAYYGDHVELSDNASDFASSFGIGAVLGSKFTWPKDNPKASESFLLTPEKEVIWKKWIGMYNEMMLSKENYLGKLYDIGFDKPEAHVIQKDNTLYYAFYAKDWDGEINFKGLNPNKKYKITDYFNDKSLGAITSSKPTINIRFKQFLLVKAEIID